MKKKIICLIMFISLLFFPFESKSYDYVNKKNATKVVQSRKSVYELYNLYKYLFPQEEIVEDDYTENACGTGSASPGEYIWPIGSDSTTQKNGKTFALGEPNTVYISSGFGPRPSDPQGHGALDIAPSAGPGVVNVIASNDGEVVYSQKNINNASCPDQTVDGGCGGGYGNYVVIKHSENLYTLYGHMHAGTLTVNVGDKVSQGQVIGKVGNSGNSFGAHLHFEFTNAKIYRRENKIDPLKYVDPKNPRGKNNVTTSGTCGDMSNDFVSWIDRMEGEVSTGDYYIADSSLGDMPCGKSWTIGHGLTYCVADSFRKNGIDPDKIKDGDKFKKEVIDKVYEDVLLSFRKKVEKQLKNAGINVNNNQILALTSMSYNGGETLSGNVINSYKNNGNSTKVFHEFCTYVHDGSGRTYGGLVKRRKVEWMMFTSGIMEHFDTQSSDGDVACIGNFNIPSSKKNNVSEVLKKTAIDYNGKITYK